MEPPVYYAFLFALVAIIILNVSLNTVMAFPGRTLNFQNRYSKFFLAMKRKHHSIQSTPKTFDDSCYGPFEEGYVQVPRKDKTTETNVSFSLYYRIYNSNKNRKSDDKISPLVVLHGGPSLPSQYLYPMVPNLKEHRPIIFYDQLGCGKSDEPRQKELYSISHSVQDLNALLESLGYSEGRKVHLFGHSYGGSLAYEYSKVYPEKLQSLILSNAANNMKAAEDAYDRLSRKNPLGFWNQYVCKVKSAALDDAMKHVGHVWSGMDVVLDYVAVPLEGTTTSSTPRTLIIACQDDFGAEASKGWREILLGGGNAGTADDRGGDDRVKEVHLDHCAHYPHLESGESFGKVMDDFLETVD